MRLGGGRESNNVQDRRGGGGIRRGGIAVGGGLGGVVLVVLALLFGVDPAMILSGAGGAGPAQVQTEGPPAQDPGARFVRRVLAETEDVWTPAFREIGRTYEPPILVLFSGAVRTGCGTAEATVGPFYCPQDRQVYIDLEFLAALQRQLNAPGDFAAAYVIAHEVGHHVQNLLGALGQGRQSNAAQVRVELQADCLAGAWARRAQDARAILEEGDIEEGLGAAAAVGDDRLQRRGGGQVVPESFTHGSAAQRVAAFRRGLAGGSLQACAPAAG